MYTLAELAKKIQTVLGATADQLAKTTGSIKRQRQLTGAKLVRALTLGFLPNPAATLEELTQSGVLNEVEISPQGLDKRFTEEASTVLQPVLEEAVKTVVSTEAEIWRYFPSPPTPLPEGEGRKKIPENFCFSTY